MENTSSTKQLKQVLGFKELLSTAIGQIIGAGIMTLLGSAIALTGRSVPISFIISAFLCIGYALPMVIVPGTVRIRGGQYTMVGMLAGKTMAGIFVILYILSNISLAMYGISFASYFIAFFGVGSPKFVALAVLTFFFVLNFFGVDKMARFQNVIVLFMCIALGLFAAFGVSHIQPDYFSNGFFTHGLGGMLKAAGLLTFATGGGYVVVNLSAEAKNPTRDVPLAVIVSTFAVALLYAAVAFVAAGVLPVDQVAGKSLAVVALEILPKPVYAFFMVCGAMFALITTLNATYAWATKPILQACDDGWLPKCLAYLQPTYKTPVILLSILYVLGVVSVLSGLDIGALGNLTQIVSNLTYLMVSVFLWRLPLLAPHAWEKSKFRLSPFMMKMVVFLATACSIFTIWLNGVGLSNTLVIGNILVLIASIVFAMVRQKKVTMDVSYEEI